MKRLYPLTAAIAMLAATMTALPVPASAYIWTYDSDCAGVLDPSTSPARRTQFYDENGRQYYYIIIWCDGSITEEWLGDFVPIGAIPTWATPFTMTPFVEMTDGGAQMQILSNGRLAATIDFDQVEGSHAVVTTYPEPLQ